MTGRWGGVSAASVPTARRLARLVGRFYRPAGRPLLSALRLRSLADPPARRGVLALDRGVVSRGTADRAGAPRLAVPQSVGCLPAVLLRPPFSTCPEPVEGPTSGPARDPSTGPPFDKLRERTPHAPARLRSADKAESSCDRVSDPGRDRADARGGKLRGLRADRTAQPGRCRDQPAGVGRDRARDDQGPGRDVLLHRLSPVLRRQPVRQGAVYVDQRRGAARAAARLPAGRERPGQRRLRV